MPYIYHRGLPWEYKGQIWNFFKRPTPRIICPQKGRDVFFSRIHISYFSPQGKPCEFCVYIEPTPLHAVLTGDFSPCLHYRVSQTVWPGELKSFTLSGIALCLTGGLKSLTACRVSNSVWLGGLKSLTACRVSHSLSGGVYPIGYRTLIITS